MICPYKKESLADLKNLSKKYVGFGSGHNTGSNVKKVVRFLSFLISLRSSLGVATKSKALKKYAVDLVVRFD